MGKALVTNNAYSTIANAGGISASATSVTVGTGHGARFPVIAGGTGDFFYITFVDSSNNIEVAKVTATAGDVFTIARGQDGTTGKVYAQGDRVELRPTAGLFNDKVSLGGGTLTGHLEAIAGATNAQVPRVQDVVKKTGDTMSGALIVPELRGPSNIVTIPSGHRIDGAVAGSIVAPGMVVQTSIVRVDTITAYAFTTASGSAVSSTEIGAMRTTFTPKFADSKLLLQYMISGEGSNADYVWLLDRNGTRIGQNAGGTDRWYGLAMGVQGNNTFFYVDTPGVTTELTYKLLFVPSTSGDASRTFYLNRRSASPASGEEVGISQIVIQEIAQ